VQVEVFEQRLVADRGREARQPRQGREPRGKTDAPAAAHQVEPARPGAVHGEHEPAAAPIKERQREGAVQQLQHPLAVAPPGVRDLGGAHPRAIGQQHDAVVVRVRAVAVAVADDATMEVGRMHGHRATRHPGPIDGEHVREHGLRRRPRQRTQPTANTLHTDPLLERGRSIREPARRPGSAPPPIAHCHGCPPRHRQ